MLNEKELVLVKYAMQLIEHKKVSATKLYLTLYTEFESVKIGNEGSLMAVFKTAFGMTRSEIRTKYSYSSENEATLKLLINANCTTPKESNYATDDQLAVLDLFARTLVTSGHLDLGIVLSYLSLDFNSAGMCTNDSVEELFKITYGSHPKKFRDEYQLIGAGKTVDEVSITVGVDMGIDISYTEKKVSKEAFYINRINGSEVFEIGNLPAPLDALVHSMLEVNTLSSILNSGKLLSIKPTAMRMFDYLISNTSIVTCNVREGDGYYFSISNDSTLEEWELTCEVISNTLVSDMGPQPELKWATITGNEVPENIPTSRPPQTPRVFGFPQQPSQRPTREELNPRPSIHSQNKEPTRNPEMVLIDSILLKVLVLNYLEADAYNTSAIRRTGCVETNHGNVNIRLNMLSELPIKRLEQLKFLDNHLQVLFEEDIKNQPGIRVKRSLNSQLSSATLFNIQQLKATATRYVDDNMLTICNMLLELYTCD
jgi:hypothetical protein